MAFRYLIYSIGTNFANTILRESATDNPGANEDSLYTDFIIPVIQPLYLWQITGGTTVVPNTDTNIYNYTQSIAPPPSAEDNASVGYVTGITINKIDTLTGATNNIPTFTSEGNLQNSGYLISDLTGGTSYTFVGSGGTQVTEDGATITIYSVVPSGTTVAWGDVTGTLSNQTDLWNELTGITATTANKLDTITFTGYTGTTDTRLSDIESDITDISGVTDTKLNTTDFNSYTGDTQPILDAAFTGVTNLGSGTPIGDESGRIINLKSINVLGGLSITSDINSITLSGITVTPTIWGDVTGTLSDQTDLWNELTGITATSATKLDITNFNSYTGTTDTRLSDIESDITNVSGVTDTKLDTTVFNTYTGDTQPILDAALTGTTNGLGVNGRNVELGGALNKDTKIGDGTFGFTANTANILLQAPNGVDIIDTDGTNGINLESDGGGISIISNDTFGTERMKLVLNQLGMVITDSRTGTTSNGLTYAADYSANFTNESLITKRYVDAVAAGLTVKKSVAVSTTTNIGLSGLSTIDGYSLSEGDRILVKDQTDATENGIYDASSGAWSRSTDFDGTPDGEVLSGNIIPVISGSTNYNTLWVLVTPNPITVDSSELEFSLFSSPHELISGTGISIVGNTISVNGGVLAGNSISWTGNTFNVDIATGTLSTALSSKLSVTDFNTFSGTTLPANYYNKTEINSYTGTTDTRLSDIESDITNVSGVTDTKLNTTDFNSYTGTTDTRLSDIESDITNISGVTDTKLDIDVFTGYTGSTVSDEIYLTHTGGTELNNIISEGLEWDTVEISGSSYQYTGGTDIEILETGDYEISYNILYVSNVNNKTIGVSSNIILNNNIVINNSGAGSVATDNGVSVNIALPTTPISLSSGDIMTLAFFRTGNAGSATSLPNATLLIKKKNTLQ